MQLGRFAVVGLANSAISFVAYAFLARALPSPVAGAVAFALGALNGFVFNRSWTFGAAGLGSLPRYALVQGLGAATTSLVLWGWAGLRLDHLAGYVAALLLVTPTTFALNRSWTFRGAAALSRPVSSI